MPRSTSFVVFGHVLRGTYSHQQVKCVPWVMLMVLHLIQSCRELIGVLILIERNVKTIVILWNPLILWVDLISSWITLWNSLVLLNSFILLKEKKTWNHCSLQIKLVWGNNRKFANYYFQFEYKPKRTSGLRSRTFCGRACGGSVMDGFLFG